MSRENPLWGDPRVHGELLKLGIDVGETSVSKYMVHRRNPVWSKYSKMLKPWVMFYAPRTALGHRYGSNVGRVTLRHVHFGLFPPFSPSIMIGFRQIEFLGHTGLHFGILLSRRQLHSLESFETRPEGTFYTTLPGVNMENLPPAKADAVLKKLNAMRCHCECARTVASCRNHHSSCTESIVATQNEVNAVG